MERAELEKIAELAARFIQAEIADDPSAALLGSALYPLTQALQTAGYLQDISARQPQSKTPTTAEVLAWAVDMFGLVATNREERAARLLEEALEVAQCEGLDIITAGKIAGRVYAHPRGELTQEIGGVSLTLAALAENAGRDLTTCVEREWTRVKSKPREWWTAKHAEKVKDGTANIPPTPESLITGTPHRATTEWDYGLKTVAEAQASLADALIPTAGPVLTMIDNGAPGEICVGITWDEKCEHGVPGYSVCPECAHAGG